MLHSWGNVFSNGKMAHDKTIPTATTVLQIVGYMLATLSNNWELDN